MSDWLNNLNTYNARFLYDKHKKQEIEIDQSKFDNSRDSERSKNRGVYVPNTEPFQGVLSPDDKGSYQPINIDLNNFTRQENAISADSYNMFGKLNLPYISTKLANTVKQMSEAIGNFSSNPLKALSAINGAVEQFSKLSYLSPDELLKIQTISFGTLIAMPFLRDISVKMIKGGVAGTAIPFEIEFTPDSRDFPRFQININPDFSNDKRDASENLIRIKSEEEAVDITDTKKDIEVEIQTQEPSKLKKENEVEIDISNENFRFRSSIGTLSINPVKQTMDAFRSASAIGYIHVYPTIPDGGPSGSFFIPFEFNPTIDESGRAVKYESKQALQRTGNMNSYINTEGMTVSITTHYHVMHRENSDIVNDLAGGNWMQKYTPKNVQAIENALRSLALPQVNDDNSNLSYMRPPAVKIVMGNQRTSDEHLFPMLTYPLRSGNGDVRNFHRTFVVTSVKINKNMEEQPLQTHEGFVFDTHGFEVSLELMEIDSNYIGMMPRAGDYYRLIAKQSPQYFQTNS